MSKSTAKFDMGQLFENSNLNKDKNLRVVAAVSHKRVLTDQELIAQLNNSPSLKKAFELDSSKGDIAKFIFAIRPGGKKIFISHPNMRGINRKQRGKTIKVLPLAKDSTDLKGSNAILDKTITDQKYQPSSEGEKLLLEAMDADRLNARCYNLRAISRSVHVGKFYKLPSLSGASMFLFKLDLILEQYQILDETISSLVKNSRKYKILNYSSEERLFQVSLPIPGSSNKKEESIEVKTASITIIRSPNDHQIIDNYIDDCNQLVEILTRGGKSSFISTLMFAHLLFTVDESEVAVKAKITELVDNIVYSLSIPRDQRVVKGLKYKEVKFQLYQIALRNLNNLMFPTLRADKRANRSRKQTSDLNLDEMKEVDQNDQQQPFQMSAGKEKDKNSKSEQKKSSNDEDEAIKMKFETLQKKREALQREEAQILSDLANHKEKQENQRRSQSESRAIQFKTESETTTGRSSSQQRGRNRTPKPSMRSQSRSKSYFDEDSDTTSPKPLQSAGQQQSEDYSSQSETEEKELSYREKELLRKKEDLKNQFSFNEKPAEESKNDILNNMSRIMVTNAVMDFANLKSGHLVRVEETQKTIKFIPDTNPKTREGMALKNMIQNTFGSFSNEMKDLFINGKLPDHLTIQYLGPSFMVDEKPLRGLLEIKYERPEKVD